MKKLLIRIICIFSLSIGSTFARSYPIKDIIRTNKNGQYSYTLPRIEGWNYLSYKNNPLYRQTYTMLRGATYFDGRDMGMGGHQGIDIASDQGTPVYSIESGIVIFAEEKWWRGKTITIQHEQNGNKVYSSYSHLYSIDIASGAIVKEGDLIGKIGKTGNATGPHLHRQIEINEDNNHPFFYKGCEGSISEIVNEARCEKQMRINTTDPIVFIEKWGKIPLFRNLSTNTNTFNNTYATDRDLVFTGFTWGIISKNDLINLYVSPKEASKKNAILRNSITLSYDTKTIKVIPNRFDVVNNKQLMIIPQKTWSSILKILYGKKILKQIPIVVK